MTDTDIIRPGKVESPRKNRIPIMLSDDELALIDDWRFANRIGTRAGAIRQLCVAGVRALEHQENAA